jgi:hypothetical protein
MQTLTQHELLHADGRRLIVYGPLRGNLDDSLSSEEPQAIHKRLDPFTGSWVGIAPARNARPLESAQEPGVTKIRASVERGLGLFLNDVAPEDAAHRLRALAVPTEPIALDTLSTVVQPQLVPLT